MKRNIWSSRTDARTLGNIKCQIGSKFDEWNGIKQDTHWEQQRPNTLVYPDTPETVANVVAMIAGQFDVHYVRDPCNNQKIIVGTTME